MLTLLRYLVLLYQKTLSPDHGLFKHRHPYGWCQFYPTCSEYFLEATATHGYRGLFYATGRVLRCNPWSKGGIDHVPTKQQPESLHKVSNC
ncbi:membrane protein insertion efficiency factor YidD [Candidatus Uhrbacteria bacterium CG10_big_fil_rev_8_21_14_0_10_48_11]|uniref:Putative membrane protein insertion efficiency factor n=1 Tax=Candidatus Uhrbacteria bacterium CG10_big_fil_rev_8_21_14_0_10_48_11 TaxID=1975037 RepID=A0A2M8LE45_9BACT|nr:MAG: membrane protein insertion efficiency factor YidD [Candidatus Uhrbacteria bacterium CG10_big_fil_rev_8_21_14_0_10_48_11]